MEVFIIELVDIEYQADAIANIEMYTLSGPSSFRKIEPGRICFVSSIWVGVSIRKHIHIYGKHIMLLVFFKLFHFIKNYEMILRGTAHHVAI